MWEIFPACYLKVTWLIEYVGFLQSIFLFLFWYWNLIIIQSEFYLLAAATERYQCAQRELQKLEKESYQIKKQMKQ